MTVFLGILFSSIREIKVPYVFDWEHRKTSACNAGESGLILRGSGSLMSFSELRQAPGVYSRVTAGMAI